MSRVWFTDSKFATRRRPEDQANVESATRKAYMLRRSILKAQAQPRVRSTPFFQRP